MSNTNTYDDYADVSVENYTETENTTTESCDPCEGCTAGYCKSCPYSYGN